MAKCAECRKPLDIPFWKLGAVCPECQASRLEMHAQLKALTPVFVITPILVGINILVFCLMVISGVSIMNPELSQLIKWGANFGPLTLGAQPWRAFTCMFVHIGILHILLNMWCLWSLGKMAERMMGNWNFLLLYLLSGIGGSVFSLWLHPQLVTAGASGAIFGVAGGLISALGLKKAQIPSAAMKRSFQSLLIFVGYNLLYGMKGGIDNAAHVGGLLTGVILGAFLPRRAPEDAAQPSPEYAPQEQISGLFQVGAVLLVGILAGGFAMERRNHARTANASESVNLDMYMMRDADRNNLQEAAVLVDQGKTDDAVIAKLKTVVAHKPDSALAHVVLAEAYLQKKQLDQAIPELNKAVALQPKYAPAHADLGLAYLQNGQNPQAIQEYHTGLLLNPDDARAHNNLGVALERAGQEREALEEYRKASDADPKVETYQQNFKRLSDAASKPQPNAP